VIVAIVCYVYIARYCFFFACIFLCLFANLFYLRTLRPYLLNKDVHISIPNFYIWRARIISQLHNSTLHTIIAYRILKKQKKSVDLFNEHL